MAPLGVYRRLSKVLHEEIVFQVQYYAFRWTASDPSSLVDRARVAAALSRILYALMIGSISLPMLLIVREPKDRELQLALGLSTTAMFATITFFFAGLQVFSVLKRVKSLGYLLTCPISRSELYMVLVLAIVRAIDIPLLVHLLSSSLFYAVALGSPSGLLPYALLLSSSVAIPVALSLCMGLLFDRVIMGGGPTAVRVLLLAVWSAPFYMYAVFNLVLSLRDVVSTVLSTAGSNPLVLLVYPFPMVLLTLHSAIGLELEASALAVVRAGAAVYAALSALGLYWARSALRSVVAGAAPPQPGRAPAVRVKPRSVYVALLLKDVRIATRDPGAFASLVAPIAFTLVNVLFVRFDTPFTGPQATVLISSLMTLFYLCSLLTLEQHVHTYTRTLPLRQQQVVYAKVLQTVLVYCALYCVILLRGLLAGYPKFLESARLSFTIVSNAASYVTLSLLGLRLYGAGVYAGNLYHSASYLLFLILLTLPVFAAPWIAFYITTSIARDALLPVMSALAVSIVELVISHSTFGRLTRA